MSESILSVLLDARRARKQGLATIAELQRDRLNEMMAFARGNSPYYSELYRHLPERVENPAILPVVSKQKLMLRFDDWITDREVTLSAVRTFVDNPELIGRQFLGKYSVATSSGTTGIPGRSYKSLATSLSLVLRTS